MYDMFDNQVPYQESQLSGPLLMHLHLHQAWSPLSLQLCLRVSVGETWTEYFSAVLTWALLSASAQSSQPALCIPLIPSVVRRCEKFLHIWLPFLLRMICFYSLPIPFLSFTVLSHHFTTWLDVRYSFPLSSGQKKQYIHFTNICWVPSLYQAFFKVGRISSEEKRHKSLPSWSLYFSR